MDATSDQTDTVLMECVGSVRVLTLNRPRTLNSQTQELQERFVERLREIAADSEARALVITGAGRAFSSGGDRSLLDALLAGRLAEIEALSRTNWETMELMLGLTIPVIAAVHGPAVGHAIGFVALCDFVVMAEDAFLQDPHALYGLEAVTAARLIWPHLASLNSVRWILMSGARVSAEEALRLGLANRVCPTGDDLSTALEMARELAALPPAGLAATKRGFNRALLQEIAALRTEDERRWSRA
jgi:enoyl-CoA hydratase